MSWRCKWFGHDWEPYGHRAWVTDSSERIYAKVTIPTFGVCKRCGKIHGMVGGSMIMEYDYNHMTTLLRESMEDYNSSNPRKIHLEIDGEPRESMSDLFQFSDSSVTTIREDKNDN